MFAVICPNQKVYLYNSRKQYESKCKPLVSSAGHTVLIKENRYATGKNAHKYTVNVLFTYGRGISEVTIITMEARVGDLEVMPGAEEFVERS